MAGKKLTSSYMTAWENVGGIILLVVYLIVLPAVRTTLLGAVSSAAGTPLSLTGQALVYAVVLAALTVLVFHRFLLRTTQQFAASVPGSLICAAEGLVVLYGTNELIHRLAGVFFRGAGSWNDVVLSATEGFGSGAMAAVLLVIFIPLTEEALLRGLIFGTLKPKSRFLAYAVSALMLAMGCVWQSLLGGWNASMLTEVVRCLVPGLVLAWTYERTGTLWAPFLVHALFNALALRG